jgi:RNA polymerase sigma-70 factor (ECF subfamily)
MEDRESRPADELLVMDAQDGDRNAMEKLVQRWQKRLWFHAFRLTSDPEAAWDITQQTWLAIIKGLHALHDAARFKPWAYRIVTNKALDLLKTKPAVQPLPDDPIQDITTHRPEDDALAEQLDRLEPDKKALLTLYYLEGLSVSEIGRVLGIPAGTVKSRLHNARNALRSLLRQNLA